jgi:DNA-binding NarL/FixJ family response regulator
LLSPSVTRRVIDRMAQQPTPELADQTVVAGLIDVRARFWWLLARGLSNREIALALLVEESTITPGSTRSSAGFRF